MLTVKEQNYFHTIATKLLLYLQVSHLVNTTLLIYLQKQKQDILLVQTLAVDIMYQAVGTVT